MGVFPERGRAELVLDLTSEEGNRTLPSSVEAQGDEWL